MNCASVRNWLTQVESLQPKDWSHKVTDHLKGCPACRKFVNSLLKLEKGWREHPLPVSCETSKAAFLNQLAMRKKSAPARPTVRSWRPARWAAVAAVLLVGVSIVTWVVLSPAESRASEVVDRLVDLNTDLSKADYAKRKQLLDANEDGLRKRLLADRISEEERVIGEHLLKAAKELAASDDLEEDEEIVTELANALLIRSKHAQSKGTEKESEHCQRRYTLFVEKAVNPLHSKLRIIDRLIELNMEMAGADSKTRKKLFEEKEESLRQDLQDARLAPDDQAMAEKLFEVSRRMAANAELGLQVQAITEVADKLLQRAEAAEKKGKKKESDRAAIGYSMFVEKAMNPFFDKLKSMQAKVPPDGKKGGFDMSKFQKQFDFNRQRAPQFNRPEMHNRFDAQAKKGFGWPPMKGGVKK